MSDHNIDSMAVQAWLWGYPLLIAVVSRDVMTATTTVDHVHPKAPITSSATCRPFPMRRSPRS
jgi:hypothetical protein